MTSLIFTGNNERELQKKLFKHNFKKKNDVVDQLNNHKHCYFSLISPR